MADPEDAFGTAEVAQPVHPEIGKPNLLGQRVDDEVIRRLRTSTW